MHLWELKASGCKWCGSLHVEESSSGGPVSRRPSLAWHFIDGHVDIEGEILVQYPAA